MKKNAVGRPVTREDVLDHLERQLRQLPNFATIKPQLDAARELFSGQERYIHRRNLQGN